MSFSKFERSKFIRQKILDMAIRSLNLKKFAEAWDIMSEISTAGNPETQRCAENEYYKKALGDWQKYQESKGG